MDRGTTGKIVGFDHPVKSLSASQFPFALKISCQMLLWKSEPHRNPDHGKNDAMQMMNRGLGHFRNILAQIHHPPESTATDPQLRASFAVSKSEYKCLSSFS